jgi:hypothetical protein
VDKFLGSYFLDFAVYFLLIFIRVVSVVRAFVASGNFTLPANSIFAPRGELCFEPQALRRLRGGLIFEFGIATPVAG